MTLEAREVQLAGRLGGISARLERGAITAICGPNGAGKSSLLTAMAGLLPVAGRVLLDGAPLNGLQPRERARRIGYLPQYGEVAWDLSVRSLASLGRLPHGDRAAQPVDEALCKLDLEPLAERPVSSLSGGERARALLARVLAGEPQWILADEPLAALDLAHQQKLLATLRGVAGGGTGVVIVVHDLALAMNHADRVLVLDGGCVTADGPPDGALACDILARVWGVEGQWLGRAGSRALSYPISPATNGNDNVC